MLGRTDYWRTQLPETWDVPAPVPTRKAAFQHYWNPHAWNGRSHRTRGWNRGQLW